MKKRQLKNALHLMLVFVLAGCTTAGGGAGVGGGLESAGGGAGAANTGSNVG